MGLTIPLSRDGESLSRQIYQWLRESVLSGRLRARERLPSTRALAEQLNVSRTVVVLAYEQLIAEGFITGEAGSGSYVAEVLTKGVPKSAAAGARLRLSRFGTSASAVAPRVDFPVKPPVRLQYDFSYRRTSIEEFPLQAWHRLLFRRARKAAVQAHDYGPPAGSNALREAIAAHVQRSRAVVCEASQVIIVNGSQQALDLAARVLLERGDTVVLEDPHYQGARETFLAAGARIVAIEVDREGIDPARLPRSARLAFVTPSHQFPTGVILPLHRRLALLEWAKRANAVIIEDDYDGEFRYEGQPLESMQGLDTEGRVIYVGTFSRTVFPALRIGYLVAPKSLLPAFTGAKWLTDRHTPTLEQETLAEFISSGAYERHLRRARRRNAQRRRVLLDAIKEYVRDRVTVTGEGSGTHIVLWPHSKISEKTLVEKAASAGVGIYGISPYFLNRPSKAGLLVGYARLKDRELREGIRLLAGII